jgi:hypothetical protein
MRKDVSYVIVIGALALVGIGIISATRLARKSTLTSERQAGLQTVSVLTVLKAHIGQQYKQLPGYTVTGTRRIFDKDIAERPLLLVERKVSLSTNGAVVRYDRRTPAETHQTFIFDGRALVQQTFRAGGELQPRALEGFAADSIKFQLATFGLLPILKRLADPGTRVVYLGATSKGDRFQVNSGVGSWYLYTNPQHLIERLEVGDASITYGDYRMIDGLNLPFVQKVNKGEWLMYEIEFASLELNPVFPVGFFKSDLS